MCIDFIGVIDKLNRFVWTTDSDKNFGPFKTDEVNGSLKSQIWW